MIILEDTRQQKDKHKNISEYFSNHGITIIRQKLLVGDYTLPTNQTICIDTKKDLREMLMDLGVDKARFMREVALAKNLGIRLIVLIEHSENIKQISDVAKWKNPMLNPKNPRYNPKALDGKALMKRIYSVHQNYGTEFLFCKKSETGAKIVELLGGQHG